MSIKHIIITLGVAVMAALSPAVKAEPEPGAPAISFRSPSLDAMPITVGMSTDPDNEVLEPGGDDGVVDPGDGPSQADIEMAFCFVNWKRPKPNETIYAKTRAEAKKKAHMEQTWCHDGPCQQPTALEEVCLPE